MKKQTPFLTFWILNSVLVWLGNNLYPESIVLGNFRMSAFISIVVAGLIWTFLVWVAGSFAKRISKLDGRAMKMAFYFAANILAVWLTARMSALSGFGISNYSWSILLGFVGNIAQYLVWKLGRFKKMLS